MQQRTRNLTSPQVCDFNLIETRPRANTIIPQSNESFITASDSSIYIDPDTSFTPSFFDHLPARQTKPPLLPPMRPDPSPYDRRQGVVKTWNCAKGFGFIVDDLAIVDLNGHDVFCHYTAIIAAQDKQGFKSLRAGERVEYGIHVQRRDTARLGYCASDVTGPCGAPCLGDADAAFYKFSKPKPSFDPPNLPRLQSRLSRHDIAQHYAPSTPAYSQFMQTEEYHDYHMPDMPINPRYDYNWQPAVMPQPLPPHPYPYRRNSSIALNANVEKVSVSTLDRRTASLCLHLDLTHGSTYMPASPDPSLHFSLDQIPSPAPTPVQHSFAH